MTVLTTYSIAHYQAATHPQTRLLHCDVSSGNIMIYPKVKHDRAGEASLVWTGILSDWELSRPVDDQNAPPRTTQAHRLVRSSQCLPIVSQLIRLSGHVPVYVRQFAPRTFPARPSLGRARVVLPRTRILCCAPSSVNMRQPLLVDCRLFPSLCWSPTTGRMRNEVDRH